MAVVNGGMATSNTTSKLYPHTFSPAQMDSLQALLDTLIPSIIFSDDDGGRKNPDKISFYELSASQAGVPSHAAGLLCSKLKVEELEVLKWLLWLLSTRLGTLIVFGRRSICKEEDGGPFLRTFPNLPLSQREHLLLHSWSLPPSLFTRTIFNALKSFAAFSYFTKVDKSGWNPTWNAIGYSGPDPAAVAHRNRHAEAPPKRPLDGRVLDASHLTAEDLVAKLVEAGFVAVPTSGLRRLEEATSLAEAPEKSKNKKKKLGVTCDAVVVGSGCGGGVVAAVLAEAGYRVLVVEKGQYYARDDLSLLEGESLEKMYESQGLISTDDGNVLLLAGATVGGGTAVNWSASLRTPSEVLQHWCNGLGIELFGSDRYAAAMDAVLRRISAQPSTPSDHNLQNSVLLRGCQRLGFQAEAVDRNCGASDHRCGWCCFGCWRGDKQAVSETWLADAVTTGRTTILSGFEATSILLENRNTAAGGARRKTAVGVRGAAAGAELFIEAGVTIVSSGALNTPVLLQRSGLRNPHIGKHLHLHPVQMLWGYFPSESEVGGQVAYEGGIITVVSKQFTKQQQNSSRSNGHPGQEALFGGCILQCPSLHPGVFSVLMPWLSGADFKQRMERFARTVHVFALARDSGEGKVEWRKGRRRIEYRVAEQDEEGLAEAGEGALRVLLAAGAAEVGTHERQGEKLAVAEAEAEIEPFLRRVRQRRLSGLNVPLCSAHQMSSCRMGTSAETSVVGPDGGVWEAAALFVADGSVLPTSIGVNPMVTIQSVALCVASAAVSHLQNSSVTGG